MMTGATCGADKPTGGSSAADDVPAGRVPNGSGVFPVALVAGASPLGNAVGRALETTAGAAAAGETAAAGAAVGETTADGRVSGEAVALEAVAIGAREAHPEPSTMTINIPATRGAE